MSKIYCSKCLESYYDSLPNCPYCSPNYEEMVSKLLELLKPGEEPKYPSTSATDFAHINHTEARRLYQAKADLYARACEIAGREE